MSVSSSYQQLAIFAAVSTASAVATFLVARRLVEGSRRSAERDRKGFEEDSGFLELPRADPFDPRPRSGYLSWDDYFMAVAFLSAQRSKDPNKQVGACIVSQEQIILGIGYNGFPRGCEDTKLPWAKRSKTNNKLDTKYPYVCHAEMNAILNKNTASLAGTTMYVTMFPCNECAKLLIQAGVAQVVFFEDKNRSSKGSPSKGGIKPEEAYLASRKLLSMAGIKLRQHKLCLPLTLSASAKQVID